MTNQDSFGPKNPNKTRPPPQKKQNCHKQLNEVVGVLT